MTTTTQAGAALGLRPVTVRWYCRKLGVGQMVGRDWILDAGDIDAIRAYMMERGKAWKRASN